VLGWKHRYYNVYTFTPQAPPYIFYDAICLKASPNLSISSKCIVVHRPHSHHPAGLLQPQALGDGQGVVVPIPDLDTAIEALRVHGVDMPWGVESNPAGRWVLFHDPAGNLIELVQRDS
jgi:predicted enzyme related to lactoylglutathione lyase